MSNRIHPLFSEIFSDLFRRGWFADGDAPRLMFAWNAAGRPILLSDEEEAAAKRSVVPCEMPARGMADWVPGYEAAKKDTENKDARIAELEKQLAVAVQMPNNWQMRNAWNFALEEAAKVVDESDDGWSESEIAARIRSMKK